MTSSPITSWQIDGETVTVLFSLTAKSLQMVTAAMKLRHLLLGRKVMSNLDSIVNKVPSSQGYGFSSGHVWM